MLVMGYQPRAHSPASEFDGSLSERQIMKYRVDSELLEAAEEADMDRRAAERFKGIERNERKQAD